MVGNSMAKRSAVSVWAKLVAALGVVGLVGLSAVGIWARHALQTNFQAYPGSEIVVTIPSGTSVKESLELLAGEGILSNPLLARLYWQHRLGDPVLIAGEYRFRGSAAIPEVLAKIARGEVISHPVTILEGLTLDETAAHLADEGFGERASFFAAASDARLIADLDPEAETLEGYLFPDTYSFSRGTAEAQIIETLVATFHERFAEATAGVNAPTGPGGPNLTAREIVILASIVEKEALLDNERPIIAGVYANRLRRGMGLYADPTIIYALKRAGEWDGNLRRRDLQLDSPYNTYRTVGLPPGPICSPGLASLAAAATPAEVPYLYFVSRNDGSHVFAKTLAEHNRNVYEWQKLYWQRRWSEQR